jgi:uncharacterized hydantoinase/oxoprolinase family protein
VSEIDNKLKEISDKINEHIIAVKGTLELVDTSEDDLHSLLLKAIERMDNIQQLSNEMFAIIKQLFEKIDEIKAQKPESPMDERRK